MQSSPFQQNMILFALNAPVCAIYLVTKPEFALGYSSDNDAVIQFSREISRHHAQIIYQDGEYSIKDLESTNHTFLNGIVLTPNHPCKLKNGDHVAFASYEFEVRMIKA